MTNEEIAAAINSTPRIYRLADLCSACGGLEHAADRLQYSLIEGKPDIAAWEGKLREMIARVLLNICYATDDTYYIEAPDDVERLMDMLEERWAVEITEGSLDDGTEE